MQDPLSVTLFSIERVYLDGSADRSEPGRRTRPARVVGPGVVGAGGPGASGTGGVETVEGGATGDSVVGEGAPQSLVHGDPVRRRVGDVVRLDSEVAGGVSAGRSEQAGAHANAEGKPR